MDFIFLLSRKRIRRVKKNIAIVKKFEFEIFYGSIRPPCARKTAFWKRVWMCVNTITQKRQRSKGMKFGV